ncbi:MAG: 3-hydroxyacyl-CoA dehydrogenase NAD-binding domain-containing protein [Deltaproteobacteria bacterium]|nr:3-hydroxyacyl-CoA dehydrogenase NAD-binding domain-containing protein [Deltaproteobacteria bacterium]
MRRKIRTAAVIGSGVMGGGIAALLAAAGVKTHLLDIVPFDLNDDEKKDPAARNRIVRAGLDAVLGSRPSLLMQPQDIDRISIGNLEDDFDRIAEVDWIIEVVVENLKIKQDLFKRIEPVRTSGTIVSSNTSGIPLKAMSEGLSQEFRQHFLGTHFFNPVRYMKLLEIIPGEETLSEILEFMADYGERYLGKGIVWAKDTPNFVGNRIGVQGMVKTIQMALEDQMTIPEVDALFGSVMGRPKTAMFKTADLVGLDTLAHVAKNTYELVVDDDARDSFVMPEYVNTMIEKNLLGKKSQSGFYKTDLTPDWKPIRKVIDPATLEYAEFEFASFPCLEKAKKARSLPEKIKAVVYGDDKGAQFAWKAIANNLIYAANRIPEISDTIVEIDNAMKWGFNFEMGPFETWDAIGLETSVARMEKDGLDVPAKIKKMLAAGNSSFYKTENGQLFYYDFASETYKEQAVSASIVSLASLKSTGKVVKENASASLVDLGDDVFCLEMHTKMNSLNQEIVEFLPEVLDIVDRTAAGLVIGNEAGGMPASFCAGANLMDVAVSVKENKFDGIDKMIAGLQYGLLNFKYAPFPVVAAPFGLALGGGCELSLAADRSVAHAELYMGLVEIGVGVLPAGGGCLNLWRKFLESVPEAVTEMDLAKLFIPVFMSIAMAKVSTSAAEARVNGFLGPKDRIVMSRDHLIGEAKKEVLRMRDDGYVPPLKRPFRVLGQAAQGMVAAQIADMASGQFISEYDAFLARRIAYVISGGDVRDNALVTDDVILSLEREAFIDFLKQEKTMARIEHMLKTGKPLRN